MQGERPARRSAPSILFQVLLWRANAYPGAPRGAAGIPKEGKVSGALQVRRGSSGLKRPGEAQSSLLRLPPLAPAPGALPELQVPSGAQALRSTLPGPAWASGIRTDVAESSTKHPERFRGKDTPLEVSLHTFPCRPRPFRRPDTKPTASQLDFQVGSEQDVGGYCRRLSSPSVLWAQGRVSSIHALGPGRTLCTTGPRGSCVRAGAPRSCPRDAPCSRTARPGPGLQASSLRPADLEGAAHARSPARQVCAPRGSRARGGVEGWRGLVFLLRAFGLQGEVSR